MPDINIKPSERVAYLRAKCWGHAESHDVIFPAEKEREKLSAPTSFGAFFITFCKSVKNFVVW